jgi:hypothetical protein
MSGPGGYQAPRNPAPASGPGRLSRRTDGGPAQKIMTPTGLPYGATGQLSDQEHAAPLSQSPSVPTAMPDQGGGGQPELAGMTDPTTRPGEPVTAGVDIGEGPGSSALARPYGTVSESYGPLSTLLAGIAGSDATGAIASLLMEAQRRGV